MRRIFKQLDSRLRGNDGNSGANELLELFPVFGLTLPIQPRTLSHTSFKDFIMNAIHAGITISVTELRESPTRILKRAEEGDQTVAILIRDKPAGYIVSPRMMGAMLDSFAESIAETSAKNRLSTINKARKVTLDDL